MGVGHTVSSFLLIFFEVLFKVLNVRNVDENDTKKIKKTEAEHDFVGRFISISIFIRIKYFGNRIKEFYLYLIGIAGVKYA